MERNMHGWRQVPGAVMRTASTATPDRITTWRLVTNRRTPAKSRPLFPGIVTDGDEWLGLPVLGTVAMMA